MAITVEIDCMIIAVDHGYDGLPWVMAAQKSEETHKKTRQLKFHLPSVKLT